MVFGDVLTMLPFLIPAYIVNDMYLSGAFILMSLSGVLHHYYIESDILLTFDLLSILITLIILTNKSKITEGIKKIIILSQITVFVAFVILSLLKIRLPWRIHLIIMSVAWLPLFIFLVPFSSNITKVLMILAGVNYMIHTCSCDFKYEMTNITWGISHVLTAALAYFIVNDLNLVKPMFSIKKVF
jgi:hypothetical protein